MTVPQQPLRRYGIDGIDVMSKTTVRDVPTTDRERAEALAQARARWGSRAIVAEERVLGADGRDLVRRFVGRMWDPFAWAALGQGPTWADAFLEADRSEGLRG